MKIVSNEVKLDYTNEVGMDGVKKYYKKQEKEELYKKIAFVLFLLFLYLAGIIIPFLPIFLQYKEMLLISVLLMIVSLFFYFAALFCNTSCSARSVYLTELIEVDEFDYVTATIALDDNMSQHVVLKTYDKFENLLKENNYNELNFTILEEENSVASLIIDKHGWKLYFPQKELFDIL